MMFRRLVLFVAVALYASPIAASLQTFNPGEYAAGAPFSMSGPALFTANYVSTVGTIDFYSIPNNSTFSATVTGGNGVGTLTFAAERLLVGPTQVSILMYDAGHQHGFLEFIFPTSSTLSQYPAPLPSVGPNTNPASTVGIWRNMSLADLTDSSTYLQGFRTGASLSIAGVPEPSSFAMGCVVVIAMSVKPGLRGWRRLRARRSN